MTAPILRAGTYNLTAQYSGGPGYAASTSAVVPVEIVNQFLTTTTLTVTPNPVYQGQTANLTITVTRTGGTGYPTGTVTLLADGQPAFSGTLVNGSYSLSLSSSDIDVGTYQLSAQYGGDAIDKGSTSTVTSVTLNP